MTNLHEYISKHDGTAEAFAAKVGVSKSTISRWLAGSVTPSREKAVAVERVTNGEIKAEDVLLLGLRRNAP